MLEPLKTHPPDITMAAAAAGLLDIAYTTEDSPVGKLLLASTPEGLVTISYVDVWDENDVLQRLATKISPRIPRAPPHLDPPRRRPDEDSARRRTRVDVPRARQLTR